LPRQKQQLVKPCPRCGRDTGFVYLRKWSRSNYKQKIDYNGNKYLDYDDPVKKKLIQEPDPVEAILSEGSMIFVRSYLQIMKEFRDLVPEIFKKYPQLFPSSGYEELNIESVRRGIDVIPRTLTPLSSPSFDNNFIPDKRSRYYGLDFFHWSEIGIFSARHSFRKTAKKFNLSVNGIRKQMPVIDQFAKEIINYVQDFLRFLSIVKMSKIMSTDEELRSRYHAICETIIKKSEDECISIIKKAELVANDSINIDCDGNMQKQAHNYQYYYIIHQVDSLDSESRIIHHDGKIRCGPFTESQMPIELLLEYRRRHQIKNDKTSNRLDVHSYNAKLNKIRSFCIYYPKQIERLRNICYHELS